MPLHCLTARCHEALWLTWPGSIAVECLKFHYREKEALWLNGRRNPVRSLPCIIFTAGCGLRRLHLLAVTVDGRRVYFSTSSPHAVGGVPGRISRPETLRAEVARQAPPQPGAVSTGRLTGHTGQPASRCECSFFWLIKLFTFSAQSRFKRGYFGHKLSESGMLCYVDYIKPVYWRRVCCIAKG